MTTPQKRKRQEGGRNISACSFGCLGVAVAAVTAQIALLGKRFMAMVT